MYRSIVSANSLNLLNARAVADIATCRPLYADMSISEVEFVIDRLYIGLNELLLWCSEYPDKL